MACGATSSTNGAVNFLQFNQSIWNADNNTSTGGLGGIIKTIQDFLDDCSIAKFKDPGSFLTALWPYLFAAAGLILFAMLVWGAMEIMFGATTPKSAENGKNRITYALIGFVILFAAFWIGQIVQQIFGINIGLNVSP